MNRLTFNANVAEIGDIQKFIQTLKAWKPAWVVLMNSLGSANFQAILDTVRSWNGHVIYRHYEESDGHLWRTRTVDEHFRLLSSFAALYPDVWWYVSNEPIPGDSERQKMMDWHAALIDKCAAANIRVCVGNLATAAMSNTKADIDAGRWDTLLRKFGEHAGRRVNGEAQILLGVHTYAHALIPWHCAGRSPDDLDNPPAIASDKWPTAQDVYATPEDNWLVFREDWFVKRIQALTGKIIDVAVTEFGWDRMPNIVKDWPRVAQSIDKLAQKEVRGLPTLPHYFDAISPSSWEVTACKQLAWAEQVYPDNYRCFALFTWSHNRDWKAGYDVSGLDAFLNLWPGFNAPTPPPPPDDETPQPKTVMVVPTGTQINIRERPDMAAMVIGKLSGGEIVTLTNYVNQSPDFWAHIQRPPVAGVAGSTGYVRTRVARFVDIHEPQAPLPEGKIIVDRLEYEATMHENTRLKREIMGVWALLVKHAAIGREIDNVTRLIDDAAQTIRDATDKMRSESGQTPAQNTAQLSIGNEINGETTS